MTVIESDVVLFIETHKALLFELRHKSLLITGATGLIGGTLIKLLLLANHSLRLDISIFAQMRSEKKAEIVFGDLCNDSAFHPLFIPLTDLLKLDIEVDYVVHGASITSSKEMIESPVDVITCAVDGTKAALAFAQKCHCLGFVYLSSMEVYGCPAAGTKITEKYHSQLDSARIRNSYPISKICCESLSVAYASQYDCPAKIVRLAQVFGPGIVKSDKRLFALLANSAMHKTVFVMKSAGKTERACLYTADAVAAILYVLVYGEKGEIYNAADERTYSSVYSNVMQFSESYHFPVNIQIQDGVTSEYPDESHMDLDTQKIKSLGWKSIFASSASPLKIMFARMIQAMH